ncbi:MAG: tetratricopeptide repeat protein [Planctomycetota bacterium]
MRLVYTLALFLLAAAASAAPADSLDRELREMEAEWSAPAAGKADAGAWLDRLVALEPRACERPAFWFLWGSVGLEAGNARDAALGFSVARRMGHRPRVTRLLLARALLDWSEEIPRGAGDRPDLGLVILQRCRALTREGIADESLPARERSELEALDLRCLAALGAVLHWSMSFVGAEETFRELIRRQPEVARHRIRLGRTLLALKKPEEALDVVREARRLCPDPSWLEPEALLGTIHSTLGHEEVAERHYANYLAGRPDNVVVLKRLGEHYLRFDRFGPAVETYRRLVELVPKDAGVVFSLATALRRLGRTEEAEKYMAIHRELADEMQERRGVRDGGD